MNTANEYQDEIHVLLGKDEALKFWQEEPEHRESLTRREGIADVSVKNENDILRSYGEMFELVWDEFVPYYASHVSENLPVKFVYYNPVLRAVGNSDTLYKRAMQQKVSDEMLFWILDILEGEGRVEEIQRIMKRPCYKEALISFYTLKLKQDGYFDVAYFISALA